MKKMNKHPERRRVEILCGLCEEKGTLAGSGVCYKCRALWEKGKEVVDLGTDEEKAWYAIPRGVLTFSVFAVRGEYGSPMQFSIESLIETLIGVPFNTHYIRTDQIPVDRFVMDPVGESQTLSRVQWVQVLLTPAQAKVIRRSVELIRQKLKEERASGYRLGSGFVVGLAKGDVTMEELNKHTLRREENE